MLLYRSVLAITGSGGTYDGGMPEGKKYHNKAMKATSDF
jgi:hypothetical protein